MYYYIGIHLTKGGQMNVAKFQENRTYFAKSICDSSCLFNFRIIQRTGSIVTVQEVGGETKRKKVKNNGTEEFFKWDNYSMAPTVRASREIQRG